MFSENMMLVLLFILSMHLTGCTEDDDRIMPPPTNPIPYIDSDPSWSPDGQLIAFFHEGITEIDHETGYVNADPDSQGIWLVRPDGTEKHIVKAGGRVPDWDPSAQWLAVTYGMGLWKFKVDGDSLTQLTFSGSYFFPSWSPRGDLIASSNHLCDQHHPCGIYLTSATGSGSFYLTSGYRPTWGPKGESLLYVDSIDGKRGIVRYDLAKATAQIIYPIGEAFVTSGPRYGPDGISIAVGLDYQIWTMDADGTDPRRLDTEKFQSSISWSPDGTQIAYAPGDGLWIINADGTDAHQITFPPN